MKSAIVVLTVSALLGGCSGIPMRDSNAAQVRSLSDRVGALEAQVEFLLGVAHTPRSSERIMPPKPAGSQ